MTNDMISEILGGIAGGVLVGSSIPVFLERWHQSLPATKGERRSRLAMAAGNALWVVSGLLIGHMSLAAMCMLSATLQLFIWWRMTKHPG